MCDSPSVRKSSCVTVSATRRRSPRSIPTNRSPPGPRTAESCCLVRSRQASSPPRTPERQPSSRHVQGFAEAPSPARRAPRAHRSAGSIGVSSARNATRCPSAGRALEGAAAEIRSPSANPSRRTVTRSPNAPGTESRTTTPRHSREPSAAADALSRATRTQCSPATNPPARRPHMQPSTTSRGAIRPTPARRSSIAPTKTAASTGRGSAPTSRRHAASSARRAAHHMPTSSHSASGRDGRVTRALTSAPGP